MRTLFSAGPRLRQSSPVSPVLPRLNFNIFNQIALRFASVLALLALVGLPVHAQVTESVVPLSEHTPPQVLEGTAMRIGHYNAAQKLRLTFAVKPPHLAEEEEFLRELVDRNSPNFHKFLSSAEWDARFAPSAEDEQAVVDWAVSQGFTVTHRFDHRLLVDAEAPAGVIEKAFGVTINQYQYGDEVDFSNDRDPVIPAHLQGILYNIEGLNSIQRDHGSRPGPEAHGADYAEGPAYAESSHDQADALKPGRPVAAAGGVPAVAGNDTSNFSIFDGNGYVAPGGIFNSQIYNYDGLQNLGHCCNPHNDSGGTPNVSNIAIAAFGNFNGSDISGFQGQFPYLAYNWNSYDIDGSIDCTTNPGACPSGETTQDVEWTIATANDFGASSGTSHIYVYIGGNFNNGTFTDMYGYMLSDNYARVFTTSWSCTEVYGCSTSTMDARHAVFDKMLGQGWTLIAASGDRGSADDCNFEGPQFGNSAHESVAYPGSDYDVLAAGGTQLQMYTNGTWDYEHGWQGGFSSGSCKGNGGGSGGGVSSYYGKPGFQGYSTWSSQTKRSTPDISLNALGIGQSLYINGTLQCCANGTSIVAPELAGFFAQENAYLNYIGSVCGSSGTSVCTPVGNAMGFFYPAAFYGAGYVSHFPFYDMVNIGGTYCNDNDVTVADGLGYYCDQTGWDNVTGWGSANMLQLAWAINWYLIPSTDSSPSVNWTGPATGQWYNTDQIVSWNITDGSGSSTPSSGIAGFTQGWDSIPTDSFSQPNGGTNDSFYWGPQYANVSTGCLSFNGAGGCANLGGAQGCHTAHVRGWNNQGWTTGDQAYGSVCYDTVAPTITAGTNPSTSGTVWVDKSVVVTLNATDPGGRNASGTYKTYYGINTGNCTPGNLGGCSVYSGPFTISTPGQTYIYYMTEDHAGNFSSEPYIWVSIDETAPVTTSSLSGTVYSGSTYKTAVQVTLNASDTGGSGVKNTFYKLDGGSQVTYSGSAFTVSALGSHTVTYWSTDVAGNTESAKTVSFSIASPTTAGLVATPSTSFVGQSVKMTATITATLSGTPTGSVIFWNGATNLGTRTLSGGVATLITSALPAGALTLQASYVGAGNYLPTNSVPFDETVVQAAALSSPAGNTVLAGPKVTFNWSTSSGASGYGFRLGTTVGGNNVYASGQITATSVTPSNLPINGETIYARLYTYVGSYQTYTDYVFTAATAAALTSPTPSTTLAGSKVTFTWSAGNGGIASYAFRLGTTVGGNNLYGSGVITATTRTVANLPTNGETIHARLYTNYTSGVTTYADYTFTAAP